MSENENAVGQPEPVPTPIVPTTQKADESTEEQAPTPKKIFSRGDVRKHVEVKVVFPKLYKDYEPWGFKFRLKLSNEAEDRRQEYLSLSASQRLIKVTEQALDEVCDLLVELPTGFEDLQNTGKGPGHSFRSYVETATDPDAKDFLSMLVEAADSAYWGAITPHEFRS